MIKHALVLSLFILSFKVNTEPQKFRVMAWNIWGKLNEAPRYNTDGKTNLQKTIEIIKHYKADVVVMVETYGSAKAIAEALGFHYYTPSAGANLCIFSRYPLSDFGTLKGISSFSFIRATVNISETQKVRFYPVWITSGGRHINKIHDKNVSDEAFTKGDDLRDRHLHDLLKHEDFKLFDSKADELPVIIAGDLNCVSHLDYTEETKKAGLNNGRILKTKATLSLEKLAYIDSYRFRHPKITEKTLGYTWTTVGQDYTWVSGKAFVPVEPKDNPRPQSQDPYARIDYIFYKGSGLKATRSKNILHHPDHKDKLFPYFPSDHGAVLTEFIIK